MKTFVISLERSVERRERVKKLLDTAGITFEFIDAADAKQKNFKYSQPPKD